jgi:PAS domain S-box-containing protein
MDVSLMTNDALREILQSMSEGIVMVEESGRMAIANPVADQLFGYERDELTGMALENLLPERYRDRHLSFRKGFNAHPEPRKMGIGRGKGSTFFVRIPLIN